MSFNQSFKRLGLATIALSSLVFMGCDGFEATPTVVKKDFILEKTSGVSASALLKQDDCGKYSLKLSVPQTLSSKEKNKY